MYANLKKILWVLLLVSIAIPHTALAASGTPSSNNFGYGVRVDIDRPDSLSAIQEAGKFNLDWIAIDFNWQHLQPQAENPPNWVVIDHALAIAAENKLAVMVSVTQAPIWAMDHDGPSSDRTRKLVSDLVHRYSDIINAIEIFPSANTVQGWGTNPNPKAYSRILEIIKQELDLLPVEILIVGAGLTPIDSSTEGMGDLSFLTQIYAEGVADFMPLVGVRLPPLSNDPLKRENNTGEFSLRHYEEIRRVMSENGHKNGLIWITGFSWNADSIGSPNEQAAWMKKAYLVFRSQLSIGVAFFDGLNPSKTEDSSLLLNGGVYHPGFEELIQIIAQDHNKQTILISIDLTKRITNKNYPKANTVL